GHGRLRREALQRQPQLRDRLFQPLLSLLASYTERDLGREIEFLKAENEIPGKRVCRSEFS
ncbi:MAG: hypothetical protein WD229_18430, partial [Pirellulales bacterium]